MELYQYDPTKPPPEVIGISLAEYDQIRLDLTRLLDCHKMIRRFHDYLHGSIVSAEDLEELRRDVTHLVAVYKIT